MNRREDDIGSPLSELNLVRRGEDNRYLLNFGTKKSLSPELFLECLVNFWEYETVRLDQNINSFKLSSLLHEPLSPGRIFLLDERELTERLEAIEEISEGALIWSETAGISEVRRTHHYDRDKLLTKVAFKTMNELSKQPLAEIVSINEQFARSTRIDQDNIANSGFIYSSSIDVFLNTLAGHQKNQRNPHIHGRDHMAAANQP